MKNTVNERVRELRNELNLSQEKFSDLLGMTKTGLWKLENGDNSPRERTLINICNTFGVSKEWLIDGVGELVIIKPIEKDIVNPIIAAKNEHIEHLKKQLDFYEKLLLGLTGKAAVNFRKAFGEAAIFQLDSVESVRAVA